jgi:hypothetical protein
VSIYQQLKLLSSPDSKALLPLLQLVTYGTYSCCDTTRHLHACIQHRLLLRLLL